MKVLGIVIIYNPNYNDLKRNIDRYINFIDKLIIWSNTPEKSIDEIKKWSKSAFPHNYEKIVVMGDQTNIGISKALNVACKYVLNECYDYLLTMDQDTFWVNFEDYIHLVTKDGNNNTIYGARINSLPTLQNRFTDIDHIITSGSIYSNNILKICGNFYEPFFIDGIDIEYCYRAQTLGLKVQVCNIGSIIHEAGSKRIFDFKIHKFFTYNYAPNRVYEILKSLIVIKKKYPMFSKAINKSLLIGDYGIKMLLRIVLFENQKIKKVKSFFEGIHDGYYFKET